MYSPSMLALLTYVGIGVGLAIIGLSVPSLGRKIDDMAARAGMKIGYGRAVWLGGTAFAWPIGLYVLATGRLVLVSPHLPAGDNDAGMKAKIKEPLPTETGR